MRIGRGIRTPLECLKATNPLRQRLEQALAAGATSDELLDDLCRRVGERSGWELHQRAAICWYLRHAGADQRDRAARALSDLIDHNQGWRLWRIVVDLVRVEAVLFAAFVGALVLSWPDIGERSPRVLSLVWSTKFMLPTGALTFALSHGLDEARVRRCKILALESLAQLAVPSSAAAVARAAMSGTRGIERAAVDALYPVLASIRVDHCGPLDDSIPEICELLRHRSPAVRLAALEALGRFAGGRAVEPVNDLTFEQNPPEIEEALARVLPILRERQRQEREAASLLRPADAPSGGADVLLRPAASAPAEDPAQLLRAVEEAGAGDGGEQWGGGGHASA